MAAIAETVNKIRTKIDENNEVKGEDRVTCREEHEYKQRWLPFAYSCTNTQERNSIFKEMNKYKISLQFE
jgi:hypothetical protein